jgi:hypothetical protein
MFALPRVDLGGVVDFFRGFYDFSEDENLVEIKKVLAEIRGGLGTVRLIRDPFESLICRRRGCPGRGRDIFQDRSTSGLEPGSLRKGL